MHSIRKSLFADPSYVHGRRFFWDGRNMGYQTLHSPIQRLRLYGPTMSDAVAREVLALNPLAEQRLIDATDLSGLLSAVFS